MKKILLGMTSEELRQMAVTSGEKEFRGKQVADWIYRNGCREIEEMKNLPEAFKIRMVGEYETGRSDLIKMNRAKDGTFKLLLRPAFGELVETVGIPYLDRFSCCVSTQVGCPVGCAFCATGTGGFKRNLAPGEIIDQVLTVQEIARRERLLAQAGRVSHVVFMGMGEPLINYDATLSSLKLLNEELNIGMRNLTVSSIGYVPGIYKLSREKLQLTLAVSLHASEDSLRRKLVPGMSRYTLKEIVEACRDYFRETGRRISFEYCLMGAVNDSADDASRLAALLRGVNCHVNLIPYNHVEGCSFKPPDTARVALFRKALEDAGITVTQREQRGAGIDAACGQLRRKTIGQNAVS